MEDWAQRVDKFLEADDRDVLQNSGNVFGSMSKNSNFMFGFVLEPLYLHL